MIMKTRRKKIDRVNGKLRKKALQRELRRIMPFLIKGYHPQQIILFGSLAIGKVRESSDIDLAVIRSTPKKFLDRIDEIMFLIKPRIAIDIFPYTPKEFASKIEEGAPFFTEEIQKKGKIIVEKKIVK